MIAGVGLHSAKACQVRFHRADERQPICFYRQGTYIPAIFGQVVDTQRSTSLCAQDVRVATVEHLLAALHMLGWWRGLVIELSAEELPILDGSAAPWLEPLSALGTPPPAPEPFTAQGPCEITLGESRISLNPGPISLSVGIAFDHPAIGEQHWYGTPQDFPSLAAARTFGFVRDLPSLHARGLAGAAGLNNAIVFDNEGPLQRLRFPDEPVRHKALDALGDLFLLGSPIQAALSIWRGSHSAHYHFLQQLAP